MEKSLKSNLFSIIVLFILLLSWNLNLQAKDDIEALLVRAIKSEIKCDNVKVKIEFDRPLSDKIKNLIVRIEGGEIGNVKADYITFQLDNPLYNLQILKKNNRLRFISSSNKKINILLSVNSLQNYLMMKAKEFGKNNVNIKLKYSPPFIECFYSVPTKEIASETVGILKKFLAGDKLEGYAAFTLKMSRNEMSAYSSKVILNHFLLPNSVLKIFENKFNPFDSIQTLKIIDYQINNIAVQPKYILISN